VQIIQKKIEEKATMVWPRQKSDRGENTKINYGMETRGEEKRGWKEHKQP
jgi:hypothetical protein